MSFRFAKMSGSPEDADRIMDFRQEAVMALYKAAMTFDLDQEKVTFGLYAKICIRNALVSVLRSENKEPPRGIEPAAEIADPRGDFPSNQLLDSYLEKEFGKELLAEASEKLSPYEFRVFRGRTEGKKISEIAEETGRSVRSVNNALYRLRSKLRGSSRVTS